jgi:hypothetical protein
MSPVDAICAKRNHEYYALCEKIESYPNLRADEARILKEQLREKLRNLVTVLATIREYHRSKQSQAADDSVLRQFQLSMPKPSFDSSTVSATIMQHLVDTIDAGGDMTEVDVSFEQLASVLEMGPSSTVEDKET